MAGTTSRGKRRQRGTKREREAALRAKVARLTPSAGALSQYAEARPTPASFWQEGTPTPPSAARVPPAPRGARRPSTTSAARPKTVRSER
jgi:hypothetical protein